MLTLPSLAAFDVRSSEKSVLVGVRIASALFRRDTDGVFLFDAAASPLLDTIMGVQNKSIVFLITC